MKHSTALISIITEQIPKAGTQLPEGSIVELYSDETRSSKKRTEVPDLKGMSYNSAKNLLSSKKLNINVVGTGQVISQDPIAGTEVNEGTVVTVTLQKDVGSSSH